MQYCVSTAAWLGGAAAAVRAGCCAAGWLAATASITAQMADTAKKALFMAETGGKLYISQGHFPVSTRIDDTVMRSSAAVLVRKPLAAILWSVQPVGAP